MQKTLPRARIAYEHGVDIYTVSFEGWTCSLGVFPVSIKNEDFLAIANDTQTVIRSQEIKEEMMKNSGEGGSLFFSVERFDYTKGILEKLKAWKRLDAVSNCKTRWLSFYGKYSGVFSEEHVIAREKGK